MLCAYDFRTHEYFLEIKREEILNKNGVGARQ
jgi:hypothetical protein